jgi:hypothetical protein
MFLLGGFEEELDGQAVSALGLRSRTLSNGRKGHRMGDQNLLPRAPPCFGRNVKLLVPSSICSRLHLLQFQGRLTSGRRLVVKKSFSQHDE